MRKKIIKAIKYTLLAISTLFIVWCAINWNLVKYLIFQGYGQISLVWKAKPVEEVMADPAFPDSLKIKLKLIQEIRQFAIKELGLHDTKNYTTVFDQRGRQLVWLVKACPPYDLRPYQWTFPIFGSFGYLGFFDKNDAQKEQKRLQQLGLDTRIGNVGGWSTLGFFKDPILTNMLYRDEGDLAELIIHELTHATVFVKNKLQFNENLASFIGEKGAELFLEKKYGKNSKPYNNYVFSLHDGNLFYDHILHGTKQLDSLYKSFTTQTADSVKRKLKEAQITRILQTIDTLPFRDTMAFRHIHSPHFKPNNTFFIGFTMYRSNLKEFEDDFKAKFNSDLKLYIKATKEKYN
jgi:predicted aminopeptidase